MFGTVIYTWCGSAGSIFEWTETEIIQSKRCREAPSEGCDTIDLHKNYLGRYSLVGSRVQGLRLAVRGVGSRTKRE